MDMSQVEKLSSPRMGMEETDPVSFDSATVEEEWLFSGFLVVIVATDESLEFGKDR